MNEQSIEKIFSLEEIDYSRFWGQNDRLLDLVRLLFPKIKLILSELEVAGSLCDDFHFVREFRRFP